MYIYIYIFYIYKLNNNPWDFDNPFDVTESSFFR